MAHPTSSEAQEFRVAIASRRVSSLHPTPCRCAKRLFVGQAFIVSFQDRAL
jgi:hypothetical protein